MIAISILDEIIHEQRRFYATYNQCASVLRLNIDHYKYLRRELDRHSIPRLHGMRIVIDNVKRPKIDY